MKHGDIGLRELHGGGGKKTYVLGVVANMVVRSKSEFRWIVLQRGGPIR